MLEQSFTPSPFPGIITRRADQPTQVFLNLLFRFILKWKERQPCEEVFMSSRATVPVISASNGKAVNPHSMLAPNGCLTSRPASPSALV
jgi:hypothetical protein